MLHAGLDLSRKKLDVCLLSEQAEIVEEFAAPPDVDGLRRLAPRRAPAGAGAGRDRADDGEHGSCTTRSKSSAGTC